MLDSLGAVTPILAIASRAERATLRAARELRRRQVELGIPPDANDGTAVSRAELERLVACHRTDYPFTDWSELAAREPLPLPVRSQEREKAARRALATWQPSWHDRMFGDEAQKRRQLAAKVFEAAREDELAFQKAFRAAEAHNTETLTARKLFELDPKAIKEAITKRSRLAQAGDGVNSLGLAQPGGGRIVAVVEAIQDADVAFERISGPGAREPIPAAERRQIHLTALCSAALRVGAEMVSLLPLEAVEVVVCCELASGAGRSAAEPVVQLLMTRRAVAQLNWKTGEAVGLATSLGARLDWSIEKGFSPIRPIGLSAMGRPLAASA